MEPTEQNQTEHNQNEGQEMQPEASTEGQKEGHKLGPIVGVIVIVALIIFGGLYMWNLQQGAALEEVDAESDPMVEKLQAQGSSDATSDIESDLDATELDRLDEDFTEIEQEFGI